MMKSRFKYAWTLCAVLVAGCGGSSYEPAPPRAFDQQQLAGYWAPKEPGNEAYEFYSAPITLPFSSNSRWGKVLKNGQPVSNFYWNVQADGSIKLNVFASTCSVRPVDLCPSTATATIEQAGGDADQGQWTLNLDDNADGKIDRTVVETYTRSGIDLSTLAQGEHHLNHAEVFNQPLLATVSGSTLALRMTDIYETLTVNASTAGGKQHSVPFIAGEAHSTMTENGFVVGKEMRMLPVKVWLENMQMSALANGRYLIEYEVHRRVTLPADVDKTQVELGSYETPERKSAVVGDIHQFIRPEKIQAGDTINTFMLLDFNGEFSSGGANELVFTSATEGLARHVDIHKGKYSETRNFTWRQRDDGALVLAFGELGEVVARFVKQVNGGYQVLYTYPNRLLGMDYVLHDWIRATPTAVTPQMLPGRYVFTSSDGVTQVPITFHKNGKVSGEVEGYWFQDSNGDIVSYECRDLAGKEIASYAECFASFENLPNMSFAHVRRMNFMHKDGSNYQVKYDAIVYGERFQVVNRDYYTIDWTYRWKRVGDE